MFFRKNLTNSLINHSNVQVSVVEFRKCVCLFTAHYCQKTTPPDNHKYSHTVLLPKTSFLHPSKLKGKNVVQNELNVQKDAEFSSTYQWQRSQNRLKTYTLHDGPPYANGDPHMGHAVNKVLKDITLRCKLLQGYGIHYIPGWDCHGLPIELKALEKIDGKNQQDPITLRNKARKFAENCIEDQKKEFVRWGILADWNHCYKTFDKQYVARQLDLFWQLYEKGLIHQDYLPVYYSPSSGTALAESELEYNLNHKSVSLYLALPVLDPPLFLKELLTTGCQSLHLAVWTTTPWSLVGNEAVCFSAELNYSLVSVTLNKKPMVLVWAEKLLPALNKLGFDEWQVLISFKGSKLEGIKYHHPVFGRSCPCLPGHHVTTEVGTGLVHTAPAHGHDDFKVALKHKLPLDCHVDGEGRYKESVGPALAGRKVLDGGSQHIVQMLTTAEESASNAVVLKEEMFVHSYPYDWRTKKPVVILACKQWFVRTDELKGAAIKCLHDVTIKPDVMKSALVKQIENRPYWCISRQRVWGVPIPVFYDEDGPVINRAIVAHVASVFSREGADAWWKLSEEELLPAEVVAEYASTGRQFPKKGDDILDIWFDSGSSWHNVLQGVTADLYLEGIDQFNGWFLTSLLTSVGLNGRAPFKNIFVHGFALDSKGQKMSKSLGNVIHPQSITDGDKKNQPFGADVLRWWVAGHAASSESSHVSRDLLQQCRDRVGKMRSVLYFLLGCVGDFDAQKNGLPFADLILNDQYMLHQLFNYSHVMWTHYNELQYEHAINLTLHFVTSISAFYFSIIKDRLYCEREGSNARMSAQTTLHHLLLQLLFSLAPVLPHLSEEAASHLISMKGNKLFHQQVTLPPADWHQPTLALTYEICLGIRQKFLTLCPTNWVTQDVHVKAAENVLQQLKIFQSSESSNQSCLCELLQVSRVTLVISEDATEPEVESNAAAGARCLRCRRFTAGVGTELCVRCSHAI